jgi:SAM-dependent methyltransferase
MASPGPQGPLSDVPAPAPPPAPDAAFRTVQAFYERRPFPGYAPGDDAATILDRGRSSSFLDALDRALPASARILDCGAGTGQVAAFLALASPRRSVVAVEPCRASLREADGFRRRAAVGNLHLVRANLFALPFSPASFEWVLCRGVVHHTADPERAIRAVAAQVAPGGVLLLGFYESLARAAHRARRALGRFAGRPIGALDPILRRSDLDPEKKRTWIEDQYLHPVEHILPLPAVARSLERLGFEWVRSVPPEPGEAERASGARGLFTPEPRPSAAALLARRARWLLAGANDPDAGLVCLLVRRQGRS